ncbi:MAG: indole-3-glycerol-phosphate synthase [Polyangiales bacterium]
MAEPDYLAAILDRKQREVARRRAHASLRRAQVPLEPFVHSRAERAEAALGRSASGPPRVIAEIKLRSPSAGELRSRSRGVVQAVAQRYEAAGAAAVSVLCDGPGFGGSPLDLRRAAGAVELPLLFKEFVLDPLQVSLARELGASMVLLIVRALEGGRLGALIEEVQRQGMAPVVEAADDAELDRALESRARIVGVNARDLRTFRVDPDKARRALARIPGDRIAVHMSGITSADDFERVAQSRADAVLVGGTLMRAADPGARLRELLA